MTYNELSNVTSSITAKGMLNEFGRNFAGGFIKKVLSIYMPRI